MLAGPTTTGTLQQGEYDLSDPALLNGMRLSRDVNMPGSQAVLVTQYTPITATLLKQLQRHHVATLFAEPIEEKAVASVVEHVVAMFRLLDDILTRMADDLSTMSDVAGVFHRRQERDRLDRLIRDNLDDVDRLFKVDPTEKLIALTHYHDSTARHSVIAAFHIMAIGRELGWSDAKIVKAVFAVLSHDIGKANIKLDTLNWPGRLNGEQWREIQHHPLFGARLLFRPGEPPSLVMLAALLHHEWYASVTGKGYGGLTLFADHVRDHMGLDLPKIVSELEEDDIQIIQATALADVVSALEESRAYKRGLDAFKVLIIMNTDAKLGHFNPEQMAAWHRIYMRQNPKLLPVGRRMALPREKERRVFVPLPPRPVAPTPLLTYDEMDQLGLLPALRNVGMDVERIQRRGGLSLQALKQVGADKGVALDFSEETLNRHGIEPIKSHVTGAEQIIILDTWREWLTTEDLERSGLLDRAKVHRFNVDVIRQNRGICPDRLTRRGVSIPMGKLKSLGITLLKPFSAELPGSERRLTKAELETLGVTDQQLEHVGCLEWCVKNRNGIPMAWLEACGIVVSAQMLARHRIDPVRKIFYDIQVVEEIAPAKAKFVILREGDDIAALEAMKEANDLGPIQEFLMNHIGEVVMDFSDLVALPDLSHVTMGSHWGCWGVSGGGVGVEFGAGMGLGRDVSLPSGVWGKAPRFSQKAGGAERLPPDP